VKLREIMSANPVCCLTTDTAEQVAKLMCDRNIGAMPVVADRQSRKASGMITDRDLCCSVVAQGLDPKKTLIERFITHPAHTCRDSENLEACERLMQEHQIRRILVVDSNDSVIGIVSQADIALKDKPDRVQRTVAQISRPKPVAA
jgi:CBS domain-containing protein